MEQSSKVIKFELRTLVQNITDEYTNGNNSTCHKCGYIAIISIRREVDKNGQLEINGETSSTHTQPILIELINLIIFADSRVDKVRDYEIFALPGYDAAYSGNSVSTFRYNLSPHLQRSNSPRTLRLRPEIQIFFSVPVRENQAEQQSWCCLLFALQPSPVFVSFCSQ